MTLELVYTCKMEAGRGAAYWWPLVCEVLRDHSFSFGDPTLPGKVSSYFYDRRLPPYEGEQEETEIRIGSFRDMWDEVYREVGAVIVPFVWKDKDFSVEVGSHIYFGSDSRQEQPQVEIVFMLTGGQVHDSTLEEACVMIRRVFLCFKDLYERCTAVSAEIHWEEIGCNYAPWALFGETPPDRDAARGPSRPPVDVHPPSDYRLIKEPLSAGKFLFLFDPIPIPSPRSWEEHPLIMGWEFFSLFEQDEGRIDAL